MQEEARDRDKETQAEGATLRPHNTQTNEIRSHIQLAAAQQRQVPYIKIRETGELKGLGQGI